MFGRAALNGERRDFPRVKLRASVEVHVPAGLRRGQITDISRSGVQVEIDAPPTAGTPTLVKWENLEAMGEVIWVKGNSCGIRFYRPLAAGTVEEAAATQRTGAAASVSNIQTGQRRRAPWKREE